MALRTGHDINPGDDLPVVLIFTDDHVIPVTEYGHTFLKNLKKNVFPEVKTKKIHNFPSLLTF